MICPYDDCDSETHRVLRTRRGVGSDVRKCICRACRRVFETVARAVRVQTEEGELAPMEEVRRPASPGAGHDSSTDPNDGPRASQR